MVLSIVYSIYFFCFSWRLHQEENKDSFQLESAVNELYYCYATLPATCKFYQAATINAADPSLPSDPPENPVNGEHNR